MNAQIYSMPTSGSWDDGRFFGCVVRLDDMHSGVYLDQTHASSVTREAQQAIVESATCIEDLMYAPGAMRSIDYWNSIA